MFNFLGAFTLFFVSITSLVLALNNITVVHCTKIFQSEKPKKQGCIHMGGCNPQVKFTKKTQVDWVHMFKSGQWSPNRSPSNLDGCSQKHLDGATNSRMAGVWNQDSGSTALVWGASQLCKQYNGFQFSMDQGRNQGWRGKWAQWSGGEITRGAPKSANNVASSFICSQTS